MKRKLTTIEIMDACRDARKHVSKMSQIERKKLWDRGMKIVNGSSHKKK